MHWVGPQLWRLVTAMLLAGGLSFQFLMNLYMLYIYSRKLEEGQRYFGRTADYIMLVAFATVCHGVRGRGAPSTGTPYFGLTLPVPPRAVRTCSQIIALVRGAYVYNAEMMLTILYVWSQLNAEQMVSFYFGTRFKVRQKPPGGGDAKKR